MTGIHDYVLAVASLALLNAQLDKQPDSGTQPNDLTLNLRIHLRPVLLLPALGSKHLPVTRLTHYQLCVR